MNLILLDKEEPEADSIALDKRQSDHVINVLKSSTGDNLRVGVINGRAGEAEILSVNNGVVTIARPLLNKEPPRPWFDIIIAVPRPKVLHRLWAPLASLGVRKIVLCRASKVEKCYFDTHRLKPESYLPLLREGLEQSSATAMPEVIIERAFKPFIEDKLGEYFPGADKFVAHPRLDSMQKQVCGYPQNPKPGTPLPVVAIGPEGGWTEYELNLLINAGFIPLTLGDRALRTDIAVTAIIGALSGAAYAVGR